MPAGKWTSKLRSQRRALVKKLIMVQEASGLTPKLWCKEVGLSYSTYTQWKGTRRLPALAFAEWIEEVLKENPLPAPSKESAPSKERVVGIFHAPLNSTITIANSVITITTD